MQREKKYYMDETGSTQFILLAYRFINFFNTYYENLFQIKMNLITFVEIYYIIYYKIKNVIIKLCISNAPVCFLVYK